MPWQYPPSTEPATVEQVFPWEIFGDHYTSRLRSLEAYMVMPDHQKVPYGEPDRKEAKRD